MRILAIHTALSLPLHPRARFLPVCIQQAAGCHRGAGPPPFPSPRTRSWALPSGNEGDTSQAPCAVRDRHSLAAASERTRRAACHLPTGRWVGVPSLPLLPAGLWPGTCRAELPASPAVTGEVSKALREGSILLVLYTGMLGVDESSSPRGRVSEKLQSPSSLVPCGDLSTGPQAWQEACLFRGKKVLHFFPPTS